MSDLATPFRGELHAAAPDRLFPEVDAPDLDGRLAALCARGRAAFPGLALPDEAFVRYLGRVLAQSPPGSLPLAERAVEDLYLACACLQGLPEAAAAFDARCAPTIRAAVFRVVQAPDVGDEIMQAVRDAVLVGRPPEAPPKIGGYSGKGSLARWGAIVGQRLALMLIRSDKAEARAHQAMAAEGAPPADPQLAYLKGHYRGEFERALAELVKSLSDRERVLLRLNLVEGVSAERIGKIYGVSRSTAQRSIEDVRGKIADGMRERLALSPAGLGSMAGLVASQLDVSLSRLLRSR